MFWIEVERSQCALYARATGQERFKLWPTAPDLFYLRAVDARISFERTAEGQVTSLVLDQAGEHQRAQRRAQSPAP